MTKVTNVAFFVDHDWYFGDINSLGFQYYSELVDSAVLKQRTATVKSGEINPRNTHEIGEVGDTIFRERSTGELTIVKRNKVYKP